MFEVNGILYAASPKNTVKIINAKVTGRMMMLLTFSSGERRVFDAASALQGEVFLPLQDDSVFRDFKIVHGAVTWMNEEIDCAPEFMYDNSFAYNDMEMIV